MLQKMATLFASITLMFYFYVITAYIEVPVVDERMFGDFQTKNSMFARVFLAGHIVGSYFLWQLVAACAEIMVAGAVAHWYYRRKRIGDCCPNFRIGICPTLGPVVNLIQYNLVTAVAGAILILITSISRFLIDFIQNTTQKENLFKMAKVFATMIAEKVD